MLGDGVEVGVELRLSSPSRDLEGFHFDEALFRREVGEGRFLGLTLSFDLVDDQVHVWTGHLALDGSRPEKSGRFAVSRDHVPTSTGVTGPGRKPEAGGDRSFSLGKSRWVRRRRLAQRGWLLEWAAPVRDRD